MESRPEWFRSMPSPDREAAQVAPTSSGRPVTAGDESRDRKNV